MGYTHYYNVANTQGDLKVPEIAADVEAIIMASEVQIGDGSGKTGSEPILGPDEINFNAIHPGNFEDFCYPPDFELNQGLHPPESKGFSFCKTARKPYDVVVCATLIAIKHHLGDYVSVSSDGDFDNANEWGPAYDLYFRALQRELPPFFRQFAANLSGTKAAQVCNAHFVESYDNGNCRYCGGQPGS